MATTGVIDGGYIVILVDDTVIECLTDVTLNMSAEEIDITCKNTAGDKDKKRGAKEWSMDFSMNYKESGTGDVFADLYTVYNDGTEVTVKFGSQETGDTSYSGTALLNTLSVTAGNTGSLSTASGTFSGKGALTKATNV